MSSLPSLASVVLVVECLVAAGPVMAQRVPTSVAYGGELELDAPIYGADPNHNSAPAVAFDGSGYLVVYSDSREHTQNLWGTRVSGSGQVIDRDGFPIEDGQDRLVNARVAFDGSDFAVAWRNADDNDTIYFRRVSKDGVPAQGTTVIARVAQGTDLACASGQCLVAWTAFDGLRAVRVDAQGAVLDVSPIVLSTARDPRIPSIVADPTGYWIIFGDASSNPASVLAARIGRAVGGAAPTPIPVSGNAPAYAPKVARAGDHLLVVWQEEANLPRTFKATRLDASGTILDPAGIVIASRQNDVTYESMTVAALGADFLVSLNDVVYAEPTSSTLRGVRVTGGGAVLDPMPLTLVPEGAIRYQPHLAAGNGGYLLVWDDFRSGDISDHDVYGTRLDPAGTALDGTGIPIVTSPNDQARPQVAQVGGSYFVVWEDRRLGKHRNIFGACVGPDGARLAPAFALAPSAGDQRWPTVASDGAQYLVAWQERTLTGLRVRGGRVSADGARLDPSGIDLSPEGLPAIEPSAGAAQGTFLVVWTETSLRVDVGDDIRGTRVGADGRVLDVVPLSIYSGPSDQGAASVAGAGAQFFVAWNDGRYGISQQAFGTRVSLAGSALDLPGISLSGRTAVNSTGMNDWYPAVAGTSSDGVFFAAWQTQAPTEATVAVRISGRSGAHLDPTFLTLDRADGYPAVADALGGFLAVWPSRDFGVTPELRGALMVPGSAAVSPLPVLTESARQVALRTSPAGSGLLVYDRDDLPGRHRIGRIYVRPFVSCTAAGCEVPDGGVAADAGQRTDAGAPDLGIVPGDAGVPSMDAAPSMDAEPSMDAGAMEDASAVAQDASSVSKGDAGSTPRGRDEEVSCGCKAARGGGSRDMLLAVLGMLVLIRRRKMTPGAAWRLRQR